MERKKEGESGKGREILSGEARRRGRNESARRKWRGNERNTHVLRK